LCPRNGTKNSNFNRTDRAELIHALWDPVTDRWCAEPTTLGDLLNQTLKTFGPQHEPNEPRLLQMQQELGLAQPEFPRPPPLTFPEFQNILKKAKFRTASGTDEIPWCLWKKSPEPVQKYLYQAIKRIAEDPTGLTILPEAWRHTVVVLLPKGGNPYEIVNYRPISLNTSFSKLLSQYLLQQLQSMDQKHGLIHPAQGAGKKGQSCLDQVAGLLSCVAQKHREQVKNLQVVTVDWAKAFDSITIATLTNMLAQRGIPRSWLQALTLLYNRTTFQVKTDYGLTDTETYGRKGLRQGDPLSPILFMLALDPLLRQLVQVNQESLNPDRTPVFSFMDDLAVVTTNRTLQRTIDMIGYFSDWSGMEINNRKSVMIPMVGNPRSTQWPLTQVPVTSQGSKPFKYLGIYIGRDMSSSWALDLIEQELTQKLAKVHGYNLNFKERIDHHNKVILPWITYRLTFWALTKTQTTVLARILRKWVKDARDAPNQCSNSTLHRSTKRKGAQVHSLELRLRMQQLAYTHRLLNQQGNPNAVIR
jgi:hypothetical protein